MIATVAALATVAAVVTACATKAPGRSNRGPRPEVPAGTVVMIIRHGEKPSKSNGQTGYDADGHQDSASLTQAGWSRARSLADVFAPAQGAPENGLVRPVAIFAAGSNSDGEGARTRETVGPLAQRLGVSVNTDFGKGDEDKMVAQVLSQPGPTLICWQHGGIPAIVDAFTSVTPAPPSSWPDDRFDMIWKLTKTAQGWDFAQIPELVQPGDRAALIAG